MDKVTLEHVACNLCGSEEARLFYQGLDARYPHTPRVEFRLVRCVKCGLVYLNPRPTEESLRCYYPENFTPYRQPTTPQPPRGMGLARLSHAVWNRIERLTDLQRVRLIKKLHPVPGRILDIGCATGRFLWHMQGHGWQVAGVEIDTGAAEQARRVLPGAEIEAGTLESARFAPASFNVVTMFHVLEHLPDPLSTLQKINSLLRPGGFAIILVPNARNLEFWLLGRLDRQPVDIPRHLYHFSPSTLKQLLRKANLRPLMTTGFSWDATPRVTRVLEGVTENWHPRSMIGRAVRSGYELAAFAIGNITAAFLGMLATAGPAFFVVGQKTIHR